MHPTWRHFSYIYLICLVLTCPIFFTVNDAFPNEQFRLEMESSARKMYSLSMNDPVFVYGGTLFPRPTNGNRTFALYIFVGVGVTFTASYGLALFCVRSILRAIKKQTGGNISRSNRSLQVQRRFITMLILEATVPFFLIGVVVGLFTVAGLIGVRLGLFALVMSVIVVSVPAVQALLYISHLGGSSNKSSHRSTSKTNTVSAKNNSSFTQYPDSVSVAGANESA
ncbi:hypothetical protein PFISCL1PPCAC_18597, partial [Pristionchus fissidentatus]